MFGILTDFLGTKYVYNAISIVLHFLEAALCIFFFMRPHKKRSFFWMRYVSGLVLGTVLCYLLAILNSEITGTWYLPVRIFCYMSASFLNLALIVFCYQEDIAELLLCWCSGLAAFQFTNKLFALTQNIFGVDDKTTISLFNPPYTFYWYDYVIFFAFLVGGYYLLSKLFARKDFLFKDRRTSLSVAFTAVITTVFINILICGARQVENNGLLISMVVKIFSMSVCIAILIMCRQIFLQSKSRQELSIIESLWKQEKMHLKSVKANIDYINTKCHDLKHILNKLEGKLNETEIEELKEAVNFYDSNIKTGNDILDVVLHEKNILAQKYQIKLSYMADGSKLDILSNAQLYSLFSNILDNAIQAVKSYDVEKRIISLTVKSCDGLVEIEEYNYLETPLEMENGLPLTAQNDKDKHGFGLKSVRYIVEERKGSMEVTVKNGTFNIRVTLPY